jgi:fluoroacetyl-CoA thioesterase
MPDFKINQKREETVEVGDAMAIKFLGPEGPRVLSTPHMIGCMEYTCRNLVFDMLDPGQDTVGTHVNVWHKAAAPMGSTVVFSAELLAVKEEPGRSPRVEFRVRATYGEKLIGEGTHQRAIISVKSFKGKVTPE